MNFQIPLKLLFDSSPPIWKSSRLRAWPCFVKSLMTLTGPSPGSGTTRLWTQTPVCLTLRTDRCWSSLQPHKLTQEVTSVRVDGKLVVFSPRAATHCTLTFLVSFFYLFFLLFHYPQTHCYKIMFLLMLCLIRKSTSTQRGKESEPWRHVLRRVCYLHLLRPPCHSRMELFLVPQRGYNPGKELRDLSCSFC